MAKSTDACDATVGVDDPIQCTIVDGTPVIQLGGHTITLVNGLEPRAQHGRQALSQLQRLHQVIQVALDGHSRSLSRLGPGWANLGYGPTPVANFPNPLAQSEAGYTDPGPQP